MINGTSNMVVHPGNGSTVEAYPIPFRFDEVEWLEVTLLRQDEGDETKETRLAAGTDYVVERKDGMNRLFTLLPVEQEAGLRIRRMTPRTQRLDLGSGTPLPAEDLERALDRLAMAVQDLGTGDGMPRNAMTLPTHDAAGDSPTLMIHKATQPGGTDRRGTVISFHPGTLPGMPPMGSISYTDADGLQAEIRRQVEELYEASYSGEMDSEIHAVIAALNEKRTEYYTQPEQWIANNDNGTSLMNPGGGAPSSHQSVTIRHGNGSTAGETGAQGFRATLIGDGTLAEGSDSTDDDARGNALLIGAGAQVQNRPDYNTHATAVGRSAMIFGYHNVSLGGDTNIGNPLPNNPDYALTNNPDSETGTWWYTGAWCTAVGAGAFTHGEEHVVVGPSPAAHGIRNCAFGRLAIANGRGTLAAGSEAVAEVPYAGPGEPTISAALAVGHGARSQAWETLAAGASAKTVGAPLAMAAGAGAVAAETGSVAVGAEAAARGKWSTAFSNGVVETGAWAAQVFGYRARLAVPRGVEILSRGRGEDTPPEEPVIPGARVFLHPLHGACLSHAGTALRPVATMAARGSEPQDITATQHGTLAAGMLTFHCDGDKLRIHVSDGSVIRTGELDL